MDEENSRIRVNADRSVTVTLLTPIKVDGVETTEITLKRPSVKHLRLTDKTTGDVARSAKLIQELGALAPSSIDQIDAEDYVLLAETIAGFFGKRPATGEA